MFLIRWRWSPSLSSSTVGASKEGAGFSDWAIWLAISTHSSETCTRREKHNRIWKTIRWNLWFGSILIKHCDCSGKSSHKPPSLRTNFSLIDLKTLWCTCTSALEKYHALLSLTTKNIPIVSCCRWILSIMSSSNRQMDGFWRVMEVDRPQRTRVGHTSPIQSQSLILTRQIPLCTPSRQYKAPWGEEKEITSLIYHKERQILKKHRYR